MFTKATIAAVTALMLGFGGTALAQQKDGASTATPSTPAQDAKLKADAKNVGQKIKETTRSAVEKVKRAGPSAEQRAENRAKVRRVVPGPRQRAENRETVRDAVPSARERAENRENVRSATVGRSPEVSATQTREQRMEEARLNWERTRR